MKRLVFCLLVLGLLLTACQSSLTQTPATTVIVLPPAVEISVSAAASLTESYTEIGQEFEKLHPEIKVVFLTLPGHRRWLSKSTVALP